MQQGNPVDLSPVEETRLIPLLGRAPETETKRGLLGSRQMMLSTKKQRTRDTLYAVASLVAAFVVSVLMVAGATRWLPEGGAGIDHIVVPIILFPLIWISVALVLYAARRRVRAWTIVVVIATVHAGLVAYGFVA